MTIPHPHGLYCYICRDQEVSTVATRLCNERRKPVCPKHAAGCYEDGHGTSELEIPMSEKLTDAEIICAWMEPDHMQMHVDDLCWHGVRYAGEEMGYFGRKLTLDSLREVEDRLTDEQWGEYETWLNAYCAEWPAGKRLWWAIHATAEQKVKALAYILRLIVEGGAL